jgi:Family of unknown function (DUF5681)
MERAGGVDDPALQSRGRRRMKPGALIPVPAEEQVGDRRPPLATRFRPGQSGNPRGRPKTASRLRALVAKELGEEIEAKENGRPVRITKLEAAVKQFVNRAANGDQRAAQFVFSLLADEPDRPERAQSPERISEGDALVMAEIVRRFSRRQD